MNEEIRNLQKEVQQTNIKEKEEAPGFARFLKWLFKIIFILLIAVGLFFPFVKIENDTLLGKTVICYNPITKTAFVVEMEKVKKENDLSGEVEDYYLIQRVTKGIATVYITKNEEGEKEKSIGMALFYFEQSEKESKEFTVWEIFRQVFFKGGAGSFIEQKNK